MLILQCILGLQSQSIDFTDAFAQADIPSGDTIQIEIPREFQELWRTRLCSPIAPRATNEVDYDFAVYARKVRVLISQMPMLRQISQVERQF